MSFPLTLGNSSYFDSMHNYVQKLLVIYTTLMCLSAFTCSCSTTSLLQVFCTLIILFAQSKISGIGGSREGAEC